ncbi:MAG: hypothetical protein PWP10_2429 [Clostridiales bacterium]|jgi:Flp pilus assembly protein CpaB|nr:hypothetical protein [Clostridiales bacterium]
MSRIRQVIFAVAAALIIGLGLWLMRPVADNYESKIIYKMKADVRAGQEIKKDNLIEVQVPAEMLTEGYIDSPESINGYYASHDLASGEFIHQGSLSAQPSGLVYEHQPAGARLMTLKLNSDQANGFWLAAGSRVDIDLVARDPDIKPRVISLENVEVAAVLGCDDNTAATGYNNPTAAKTPLICLSLERDQVMILSSEMINREIRLSVICNK